MNEGLREFVHIWNGPRSLVEKAALQRLELLHECHLKLLELNDGACPFCYARILAQDQQRLSDHEKTCKLEKVLCGELE